MDPKEMAKLADPDFLGNYLAGLSRPQRAHGPAVSIREDEYQGRKIVIKTTYEITVDGQPLPVHVSLSNDGAAHCHGLPTYRFVSVVDMVRVLIDNFPDDFPGAGPSTDDHGDHGDHGTHNSEGS